VAGDVDDRVSAFLDRPIDAEWRYLWRDAAEVGRPFNSVDVHAANAIVFPSSGYGSSRAK
jgi:hypothetical protein